MITFQKKNSFNGKTRQVEQAKQQQGRGHNPSSTILNSTTKLAQAELTVSQASSGRTSSSFICCSLLRACTDLSMLQMNSPWPWGSHQFCMKSPHQIDWGLCCSTGSPGFPWGQTPTQRQPWPHRPHTVGTHTHTTHNELRADNGISTADQGTLYNYV